MSAINVREAVEALRPVVRQAKAAVALADVLESLVGLDDHAKELARIVEERKALVAAADSKVAKAEADAVRVCAAAKEQAEKVLKDASDAAERCITDAEHEAESIRDQAATAVEEAKEQNEIARQAGKVLQAAVDDLTKKRDAIKAEIESFKAAANRVLG